MSSPLFTPKYSKEVIERAINDFEKKSQDEKDRIDLNIRTLNRYLTACDGGFIDSDYETKIDIIMKELNK